MEGNTHSNSHINHVLLTLAARCCRATTFFGLFSPTQLVSLRTLSSSLKPCTSSVLKTGSSVKVASAANHPMASTTMLAVLGIALLLSSGALADEFIRDANPGPTTHNKIEANHTTSTPATTKKQSNSTKDPLSSEVLADVLITGDATPVPTTPPNNATEANFTTTTPATTKKQSNSTKDPLSSEVLADVLITGDATPVHTTQPNNATEANFTTTTPATTKGNSNSTKDPLSREVLADVLIKGDATPVPTTQLNNDTEAIFTTTTPATSKKQSNSTKESGTTSAVLLAGIEVESLDLTAKMVNVRTTETTGETGAGTPPFDTDDFPRNPEPVKDSLKSHFSEQDVEPLTNLKFSESFAQNPFPIYEESELPRSNLPGESLFAEQTGVPKYDVDTYQPSFTTDVDDGKTGPSNDGRYPGDSSSAGYNLPSYDEAPRDKGRHERENAYAIYEWRAREAKRKAKYYTPKRKSPTSHSHGGTRPAGDWRSGHSTYYGGTDAQGTTAGACGYGNPLTSGYGVETAALSTVLFKNGMACGACYEVKCAGSPACLPGSVFVTATNFCPPNYAQSASTGGWCNPPNEHFDLSEPSFKKIAKRTAGVVPIEYRRVPCAKQGGIRFTINGNCNFNIVTITNVGASGVVTAVEMKGEHTGWFPMSKNWGSNWQCGQNLCGQAISFRVHTSDGKVTESNVADCYWTFGKTYQGSQVY